MNNIDEALQYEWLETNGLGGFSSSTITGCHTRCYHGLLVAATEPPAQRMVLLSKLDETIITGEERIELATNNYGPLLHPKGYQHLKSFNQGLFPEFVFEVRGITIRKTIAMVNQENTTLVIYEILKAPNPFILELLPLMAVRDYHSLVQANNDILRDAQFTNETLLAKAYNNTPEIFIKLPGASFQHDPLWYYHFNYNQEKERGLNYQEDLFSHGKFQVLTKEGDAIGIIISTTDPSHRDAHELLAAEIFRRQLLVEDLPDDELLKTLTMAADQFVVARNIPANAGTEAMSLKTIIAGYHWFTDWSRDTMISLPGICLSTGRYEDARKILTAFSKHVSQGLLPNRFRDDDSPTEYNNADGTLWYFIAIHHYLKATDDKNFVIQELLPVLKEIIAWHYKGTYHNIHVDEDDLLYAGEEGMQLTWMDAKAGDQVFTPRMGKPVEIQALWYNALCIYAELLHLNGETIVAKEVSGKAGKVRESFLQKFWNTAGGYLYDVIDEKMEADDTLRPNQLFAISLPYSLLDDTKAAAVLNCVAEQLYTPAGLKTLPSGHPGYTGHYEGGPATRDAAYHKGTIWPWLLGPYIDAIIKINTVNGRQEALQVLKNFENYIQEGCISSVSEIFDADPPHKARGCIAQAWSVAELLRVITTYQLL